MPSMVEIGPVVLEKRFFNFVNIFLLFGNYPPLKKGGTLHLNKFESTSPKDVLCQVWLKMSQWFWRRRFFISSMYFRYLVIFSPWKKSGALHLNILEFSSPKNVLCQVWLKLDQWFRRRRFFNFFNVFSLFGKYLPLEKGG